MARTAQPSKAVVWATFHGGSDITALMLGSIASKVYEDLREDDDIGPDGALYINGSVADATHDALQSALGEKHPGLVVTTSHGSTGPLDNAEVLRNDLGKLVDNDGALLNIDELLAAWQPGGGSGTPTRSLFGGHLRQVSVRKGCWSWVARSTNCCKASPSPATSRLHFPRRCWGRLSRCVRLWDTWSQPSTGRCVAPQRGRY